MEKKEICSPILFLSCRIENIKESDLIINDTLLSVRVYAISLI
jgi:hypothetical protein